MHLILQSFHQREGAVAEERMSAFSILVSSKLSPSLRIFLYEGRLRRHLLRSRPPSLYLVSRVWKTLNGFLMILKGRGMRAARRARKVSRAGARESRDEATADTLATLLFRRLMTAAITGS